MGGLGSMVVEAAVVLPSRSSFNLRISDDQFIDELRDFIQGMKKVNTRCEGRHTAYSFSASFPGPDGGRRLKI